MIRTIALSTLVALALAASSHAGNVQVNFSGGSGAPLTVTLPQAVSFTVTNDTPSSNANFVFQGVGNVLASLRGAAGSLSYTTNGGSALSINSVGNFNLGVVTTSDLTIFRQASPGVALNDVLLLSSGSVTTTTNVSAAAPPSGLYSAIFVDINGTQLGVGQLAGDFDADGDVDGRDFLIWQRGGSPRPADALDFSDWQTNFGAPFPASPVSTAVPEPRAALLLIVAAAGLSTAAARGAATHRAFTLTVVTAGAPHARVD